MTNTFKKLLWANLLASICFLASVPAFGMEAADYVCFENGTSERKFGVEFAQKAMALLRGTAQDPATDANIVDRCHQLTALYNFTLTAIINNNEDALHPDEHALFTNRTYAHWAACTPLHNLFEITTQVLLRECNTDEPLTQSTGSHALLRMSGSHALLRTFSKLVAIAITGLQGNFPAIKKYFIDQAETRSAFVEELREQTPRALQGIFDASFVTSQILPHTTNSFERGVRQEIEKASSTTPSVRSLDNFIKLMLIFIPIICALYLGHDNLSSGVALEAPRAMEIASHLGQWLAFYGRKAAIGTGIGLGLASAKKGFQKVCEKVYERRAKKEQMHR